MIMGKVGEFTARYPWIGILLILMITAGATTAMILKPMAQSFDQEDFLPDMDVAKANTLYTDTFTATYPFIILFRGDDGDLVTPYGFKDMILLSEEIEKNETYREWKDPSSPGPSSPASALFSMRKGVDHAEAMKDISSIVTSYIPITMSVNGSSSSFSDNIDSVNLSDPDALSVFIEELDEDLDDFIGLAEIPSTSTSTPDNATEYYSSFDGTSEFKDEIRYLLSFDMANSTIQQATIDLNNYSAIADEAIQALTGTRQKIEDILSERQIPEEATSLLVSLISEINRTIERANTIMQITGMQGNPLVFGQVAQSFFIGQFFLLNFLTEDFDPSTGSFSAKGGMILVNLDYELKIMEKNKELDKLYEIEGNISTLVNSFNKGSDRSIHPIAFASVSQRIDEASNESMQVLLPAVMIFVFTILFFIYRSFIDIAINIAALSMAVVWMYGFGSMMGYSSNPMIMAVPVLLVGLGIDYGIHLTMRYREEIRKGKTVKDSLLAMSSSVGMALLLATFTTVFAFLSNISSPVGLILEFGVMAAFGIVSSFVIMLIFIPSVKNLIDTRRAKNKKTLFRGIKEGECDPEKTEKANQRITNRALLGLTIRAEKHPAVILVSVLILTSIMFGFAIKSEVTFSINDFLPDGLQESEDLGYLLNEFRLGQGTENGVIIVEGDISEPEVLFAMDEVMDNAIDIGSDYLSYEGSGASKRPKADFILYSLKDTATMIGALDPSNTFLGNYSKVFNMSTGLPETGSKKEQINEVFVEFNDLYPSLARRMIHLSDGMADMTVIAFTIGTEGDDEAWTLFDELNEIVAPLEELEGSSINRVSITGSTILMAVIIDAINSSQISSLMITIVISFIALTIAFFIEERSLFLGGVATLPVVFCVIWIAGTMYLIGIPLNVMTITIGALTVGLGITYGIHITHRFIEDEKNEEDLLEASKKTIMNTGSALFGAALTTVGGFGLLSFATMPPLQQFGQVSALAIIYSFLSSVIVLPVLLILWAKGRRKWRSRKENP